MTVRLSDSLFSYLWWPTIFAFYPQQQLGLWSRYSATIGGLGFSIYFRSTAQRRFRWPSLIDFFP